MRCWKCGARVKATQQFCGICGSKVQVENAALHSMRATLYITPEEALYGCVKELNLPGFAAPMRVTLRPGIAHNSVLRVKNARFVDGRGNISLRPLEVTVRIQKAKSWKLPRVKSPKKAGRVILIVLACLAFVGLITSLPGKDTGAASPQKPSGTNSYRDIFADKSNQRYAGRNQAELLQDVVSNSSTISGYGLTPVYANVIKSWTSSDGMQESVWVEIEAQNDEFSYKACYVLHYVKYNEGWLCEGYDVEGYSYAPLKGADHQFIEEHLRKVNDGKYRDGVFTFVSSDLGETLETVVYTIEMPGNNILEMTYEVEVFLEYKLGGWWIPNVSETNCEMKWKACGTWELHNKNVDIEVNVYEFDAVDNTAVIDYSVVTYIDLEEYQNDPYTYTTTRMIPGQVYSSDKINVSLTKSYYGDDIELTYTVFDEENPKKDLFDIHFCGTEAGYINVNNEEGNNQRNTGVCVFLTGWGGKNGCAFWLE